MKRELGGEGVGPGPQDVVSLPDGRQISIPLPEALRPMAEITGREEIVLAWYQGLVVEEVLRREASLGHKIKKIPKDVKTGWAQTQVEVLKRRVESEPQRIEQQLAQIQQTKENKLAEIQSKKEAKLRELQEERRVATILTRVREREVGRIEAETKKAEEFNRKIGINVSRSLQILSFSLFSGVVLGIGEVEALTKWLILSTAHTSGYVVKEIFYRLCELSIMIGSKLTGGKDSDSFKQSMRGVRSLERSNLSDYLKRMEKVNRELGEDFKGNITRCIEGIREYANKYPLLK